MRELEGRGAIITGASQGLGVAIARAYVEAGASVMVCARDGAMLERAMTEVAAVADDAQQVIAQAADVSRREEVEALVARAHAELPNLQILVNNAGVYGPMGLSTDVDWDAWVRAMEINVFGSILMCRAVVPHFIAQGSGKIIQLSGGGATNPLPRLSAYAASKAAIVRFAESLALELKPHRIDVNSVAPGALNTRMMRELLDAGPDVVGEALHARMTKLADEGGTPLERGAALAVFLGSSASDGITGRLLSAVWDPWESLPERRDELDATDIYTLRRILPADRGRSWETS
jgi:NAD(P)-dependent dehydrogenase (short-subunit alcohol dehydrogenase family)